MRAPALLALMLLVLPLLPAQADAPRSLADEVADALARMNGGVLPEWLGSAPGLADVPTESVLALLDDAPASERPEMTDVGVGSSTMMGAECPGVSLVVIADWDQSLYVAAASEGPPSTCAPPPRYSSDRVRGYTGALVQFEIEDGVADWGPTLAYANAQAWALHDPGATLGPLSHARLWAPEVDIGLYWYGWEGSIHLVYAKEGSIAVTPRELPVVGREV